MRKTIDAPYLYRKRGVYYFSRRIPTDLRSYYRQPRIMLSMRTKSAKAAKVKAASLVSQLDEEWLTLRWRSKDSPLRRFVIEQSIDVQTKSNTPLMSEAGMIYRRTKGDRRPWSADNHFLHNFFWRYRLTTANKFKMVATEINLATVPKWILISYFPLFYLIGNSPIEIF